ncbi:MAG: hypothetical protein Aurels2KO_37660 [Aureliella sp.]
MNIKAKTTASPDPADDAAQDLLVAADKPVAKERRKSNKRVKSDRRKSGNVSVGVEVTHGGVSVAIIRDDGDSCEIVSDFIAFGEDSGPRNSDWTGRELHSSLAELVERYKLNGQAVSVVLGGTPCVTRALFGENANVDAGVEEVRERAHRYLSLGRGDKISAYSETAIDAKRKRAWLTVAHRDVVDTVASAVSSAGLRLVRLEHSLVSLCKGIGESGLDSESPILLLRQQFGRPEIAVSYRGELLLDYRPSSVDMEEWTGQIDDCAIHVLSKHIKCIRRFLFPQTPREAGELSSVYFVGHLSPSEDAVSLLEEDYGLDAHWLSAEALLPGLDEDAVSAATDAIPAAWIARDKPSAESVAIDLMDSLRNNRSICIKTIAATFWPIAATLLLLVGLQAWAIVEQRGVTSAQAKLDELNPARLEFTRTRGQLAKLERYQKNTQVLRNGIDPPDWNNIIKFVGRALPQGTWLNDVKIQHDASITLVGASFTNDGIYDYVQLLQDSGLFEYVTLEGTTQSRFASGPAVQFEITSVAGKRVRPESAKVAEIGTSSKQTL